MGNEQKSIIVILLGILSFAASQMTTLTFVALFVIIADFASGIIASAVQDIPITRSRMIKGAISKLGYGMLWVMAMFLDLFIIETSLRIGTPFGSAIFTIAITIYIFGVEGYSVVQNVLLWGTKAPDWFLKPFALMRDESGSILKVSVERRDQ